MPLDTTFTAQNRASTQRIRTLAARLTDEQMQHPVGQHWTVAIALAHLAWWDRRVMYVLDMTEQNGELFVPEIDIFINDLSLPLWAAIPPHEAARIAIETAETLDNRLEAYPAHLLEEIYTYNKRWVVRALHRNEHLDEVDAALQNYQPKSLALQATGTFEVKLTPQPPGDLAQQANLGRLSIDKQFHGDLQATSQGEMLSAHTPTEGSAGYVALERVTGILNGRSGSFVLQHNGLMARGTPRLTITVVPDSGTGQLAGLAGKMSITIADGSHSYHFEYTL